MSKAAEVKALQNELALDIHGIPYPALTQHDKRNIRGAIDRGWRLVDDKEAPKAESTESEKG